MLQHKGLTAHLHGDLHCKTPSEAATAGPSQTLSLAALAALDALAALAALAFVLAMKPQLPVEKSFGAACNPLLFLCLTAARGVP